MRIIVYPETPETTIGRLEDQENEICFMVVGPEAEREYLFASFYLAEQLGYSVRHLKNIVNLIGGFKLATRAQVREFHDIEMFGRIDRNSLLSLVQDKSLGAEKVILEEIRELAMAANEIAEVEPCELEEYDRCLLDSPLAVMISLASAAEVVLLQGVPLRDRFDIFEYCYENEELYSGCDAALKVVKHDTEDFISKHKLE